MHKVMPAPSRPEMLYVVICPCGFLGLCIPTQYRDQELHQVSTDSYFPRVWFVTLCCLPVAMVTPQCSHLLPW